MAESPTTEFSTTAESSTGLLRRVPAVLRQRNYALFYTGQSMSLLGDAIVPVALAFAVFGIGGSASDLGLVLAAGILPSIAFVLLGGIVADRLERRRLMIACDGARCVSQALQGVLLLTGHANLGSIVVLQLVWGTASAFFRPAATGFVPEVVAVKDLQQANALVGLSDNFAYTIGPAVAGVLIAVAGPGTALIADSASFALSALALGLVRHVPSRRQPAERAESIFADLAGGWQEFRSRTWLWSMVLWAGSFHLLALPAMLVLGPAVAKAHLGGATAWATIATGSGLGAIVGGFIALRYSPKYLLRASFLPLGLYGLALVALAVPTPVWTITAGTALGGIGVAMFNVYFYTAIQQQVPLESISRVASYDWLFSIAMLPVGQALIGPVAARTSTEGVLLVAGIWMLISPGVLYLVKSARNLRAVTERPGDVAAECTVDGPSAGSLSTDGITP